MADKLLIVLSHVDTDKVDNLLPPLNQANLAAAMDYDVEVLFIGEAGRLSIKGTAETLLLNNTHYKNIYEIIKEAHAAGVKFKVCTPSLDIWGDDLIPEICETVGGAYIINEAMDNSVVTLTY